MKNKWIYYIEKATQLAIVPVHWYPYQGCPLEIIADLNLAYLLYIITAVVVAVVLRFLVLTRVVPLVLILSAIPRNLRELMQCFFLDFKGVMTLWHTKQL